MNRLTLTFISILSLLLTACSSSDDAASRLLNSVPAQANALAMVNIPASGICDPAARRAFADVCVASDMPAMTATAFDQILSGNAGVELERMLVFSDAGHTYFTGIVENRQAFMKFVESLTEGNFSTADGIDICGSWATDGKLFWYTKGSIPAAKIAEYSELTEKKSWLSNPYAANIVDSDAAIEVVAETGMLSDFAGSDDIAGSAAANMLLGTVISDLRYTALSVYFGKGKARAEVKLLDSATRPAKYLLPAGSISPSTASFFNSDADIFVAASLPAELIEKLRGLASMAGGILPESSADALSAVSGTVAVSLSAKGELANAAITLADTTRTDGLRALAESLSATSLTPEVSGRILLLRRNGAAGSFPLAAEASRLNGAAFGAVAAGRIFPVGGLRSVTLKFLAEGKSLRGELLLTLSDPQSGSLAWLLNAAAAAARRESIPESCDNDSDEPLFDHEAIEQIDQYFN